jgi:DNA-binding NarL/FixJ family response regulator
VLIADRHPVARAGLRAVLRRDPRLRIGPLVDHIGGIEEVVAGPAPPDLIVTDLHLRDGATLDLIRRLGLERPEIAVLVVTLFEDWFWVERSLSAGARAVVLKSESVAGIAAAVDTVLRGGVFVSPGFGRRPPNPLLSQMVAGLPVLEARLTDREMAVFVLVGRGLARTEIARQLRLSPRTIDRHHGRIRVKGGFEDSVDMLRYAMLWTSHRPPEV